MAEENTHTQSQVEALAVYLRVSNVEANSLLKNDEFMSRLPLAIRRRVRWKHAADAIPKSYARDMANVPREVQRHRAAGLPEYAPDALAMPGEFVTHADLAAIVNAALRVGRAIEPVKTLTELLAPYGIRRKV